jgi:Kef-type K+ transport system membrane component KefB
MDVGEVLLHVLVVLLAAKGAAEISERVGVPAVVGEILAGILIGPSLLGLVGQDEVLRVLGELGVILLLLEVGMEMDLGELGAVGRASLSVATVGVALPFVAGLGVGLGYGMDANEALFVAAALTATSVGITARVFGDLRALATVEARTVLGAAVADDVIGLVILTVVTRVVSEGSISIASLSWIVFVAVGFLVVTTAVGIRLVPPVFAAVSRHSRSAGTLVAVAFAFALAVAELADRAQLAPIVGAFVAGLALSRSPSVERIRGQITPVGHLLIPVFFLQIGIDAEIDRFADPYVLGLAAALLFVAVAGKLASAAGLWRAPGDRLLVGIGMVPRGEVGLIFATLGLRQAVFGDDVYAALLLVILATTLLTPPALRARLLRVRASRQPSPTALTVAPVGGWVRVEDGVADLVAEPATGVSLEAALEAALACAHARPGPRILDWLGAIPAGPLRWTRPARHRFFELLEHSAPRSWRLLMISGVLERALPELGVSLAQRQDSAELDPLAALHLPRLSRLQADGRYRELAHPEWLLLAALVLEATSGDDRAIVAARRLVQRLDLGAAAEQSVARLVADANLLVSAARRLDGLAEESVLQIASHLASREQARALYLLSVASDDFDRADLAALSTLYGLVDSVLVHSEVVGREATNAVEQRRAEATRLVGADVDARERLDAAPRAYVLATAPANLARQVTLCDPVPRSGTVRTAVIEQPGEPGVWWVDVVARDRPGLLARESGVLAESGIDVIGAVAATWGDGCALSSFLVHCDTRPLSDMLKAAFDEALDRPLSAQAVSGVTLVFDDEASPWHTICTARARDQRGLLHALTTAFAVAGANVHAARVRTAGDGVIDVFELTDTKGAKLAPAAQEKARELLASGVSERGRRRRRADDRRRRANSRASIDPSRPPREWAPVDLRNRLPDT